MITRTYAICPLTELIWSLQGWQPRFGICRSLKAPISTVQGFAMLVWSAVQKCLHRSLGHGNLARLAS